MAKYITLNSYFSLVRRTSTRWNRKVFDYFLVFETEKNQRLQQQCENMKIPIIPPSNDIQELHKALHLSDVILDAIFGFSFKPPIRAPFDEVLPILNEARLPIVSVDIPSGWDVENGDDLGVGLHPNVLISLTAPKEGVRDFRGKHFLGGRFIPKWVTLFHLREQPMILLT